MIRFVARAVVLGETTMLEFFPVSVAVLSQGEDCFQVRRRQVGRYDFTYTPATMDRGGRLSEEIDVTSMYRVLRSC